MKLSDELIICFEATGREKVIISKAIIDHCASLVYFNTAAYDKREKETRKKEGRLSKIKWNFQPILLAQVKSATPVGRCAIMGRSFHKNCCHHCYPFTGNMTYKKFLKLSKSCGNLLLKARPFKFLSAFRRTDDNFVLLHFFKANEITVFDQPQE